MQINFTLKDNVKGKELSLDNLDLGLLADFLKQVQEFLRGSENLDLGNIQIGIQSGSAAVVASGADADLATVLRDSALLKDSTDLSRIDPRRARVIRNWQESEAVRHSKRTYQITQDGGNKHSAKTQITVSKDTKYTLPLVWADVELYLYGHIYDMGGKNKSNIHMTLENGDSLTIDADQDFLANEKKNHLYKKRLVKIKARQNIKDKSIDGAELISFEHYDGAFEQSKYDQLAEKGSIAWKDVLDVNEWVEEGRGNLEHQKEE